MCKISDAAAELTDEERSALSRLETGATLSATWAFELLEKGLADLTLGELHLTWFGKRVAALLSTGPGARTAQA
ncbi:hypothetical protein FDP22_05755 [Paroceanicella profunda]|uniref:Uncharacterized protein n=1 Tax=Paroceanicella profunda TaxID=2579971 RepID=A0A5B8FVE8_9RHOB|nr:hypothetical protein [Paroceanicella profunda]QDL91334.1 hypothetical protein FDP22_05755 [Paroceanicella profunda]